MSCLPIAPVSAEEQKKIAGQIYQLLGKQVRSYHTHRHMGENSSVPVELAQELMESMEYTINQAGGLSNCPNAEEALLLGQKVLEEKREKARLMLELVSGTAPDWQTECRWAALRYLKRYVESYDPLHLAHKGPENLFYPVLISQPEGLEGIDVCLFYLEILWIENQIMAGVPEAVLESFWDKLPADTLNQCESLLINGVAKALFAKNLDTLLFGMEDYIKIIPALTNATEDQLYAAVGRLCKWLDLKNEHAMIYVKAIVSQLLHWAGENVCHLDIGKLFV